MLKEKNILFAILVNYLWGKKVSSLKFHFYFAESSSLIWCRGGGDLEIKLAFKRFRVRISPEDIASYVSSRALISTTKIQSGLKEKSSK